MSLIIWGRATSSNVQPVMWLTAELGLTVTRHDVGGAHGGLDTDHYRAMNPNGLVPVMQDGAVTLFESMAILRYLAATRGAEGLWPADPVARAPVDQWMEWAKSSFAIIGVTPVFWHVVRTPAAKRDAGALKPLTDRLAHWAQVADARLADSRFLAGDTFTLADIVFATQLFRYFHMTFQRAETPHLRAYYDRMRDNPRYVTHACVDYSSLQAS